MLALADVRRDEEADRCPLCGLPKEICRAKGMERDVSVAVERCHVATAVARERDKQESDGLPHMSGIEWIPEFGDPAKELGL